MIGSADYRIDDLRTVKIRLQPVLADRLGSLPLADRTAVVAAGLSPVGAAASLSATILTLLEADPAVSSPTRRAMADALETWEERAWVHAALLEACRITPADLPRALAVALTSMVAAHVPIDRARAVTDELFRRVAMANRGGDE